MKKKILFSFTLLIICNFIFGQAKNRNRDVLLTDFTQELILLYLNDMNNSDRKDEIIIRTYTDSINYYLFIHSNNSLSYKYCRDDFVGEISYLGYSIKIYGEQKSIFYFVKKKIKHQMPCEVVFMEYDPIIWEICLYKDLSFCKQKSYKVTINGDMTLIQNLVEKYFPR